MRLSNMLPVPMAWSAPDGPEAAVVLSSRVRLARNLRRHRFPARGGEESAAAVLSEVLTAAAQTKALGGAATIRLEDVDAVDRLFLVERHLISNHLAAQPRHRTVLVGERERLSLMVNEEDHLRLQGLGSGLCLADLLGRLAALDDELASRLEVAFRREWGYLCACPTNTGTGLRASALVHLPGLSLTGQLNRVLEGLSGRGTTIRGLYGEGTKVMGDFYQLSNATTLGRTEGEISESIAATVLGLVRGELQARESLGAGGHKPRLEDLVYRSLGALRGARIISYEETMQHLSYVRMALGLGWKLPADLHAVNELVILTQPGHVQMLAGRELDAADRDFLRAMLLRRKFK